jgi:hypothetical protein
VRNVVLALPVGKRDRSTPSRVTKRSILLTNCLVIGAISADDANVAPRCSRKKSTTPDSYCSLGT